MAAHVAGSAGQQSVMHRVKLYKLNTQGLWDDKGTGHVAMEFLPVRLTPSTCEQIQLRKALRSRSEPLAL